MQDLNIFGNYLNKMKFLILSAMSLLLATSPLFNILNAQTDTTIQKGSSITANENNSGNTQPDDEFNVFLITFAIAFFSAILVASFFGAIAAIAVIGFIFLLITAGITSASILMGIYKRSFASGFKTFIIILGMLAGTFLGAGCLWLIIKFFHLQLSVGNALWIGATGGCIGGILIGLIIFKTIQLIVTYFKNKLKQTVA
jgi:hypothetical protein